MWPAKLKPKTEGSAYSPFSGLINLDLSKINNFIELTNRLKLMKLNKEENQSDDTELLIGLNSMMKRDFHSKNTLATHKYFLPSTMLKEHYPFTRILQLNHTAK